MDLDRSSGVALWKQIEQAIEGQIEKGIVRAGDRLPTEIDFAKTFGVNRHTVRQAIAGLVDRGLLRVEQGRGTFVQEKVVDFRLENSICEGTIKGSNTPYANGTLIRGDQVMADKVVAGALGVGDGSPVIRLESIGEVDGRCICVATHYFRPEKCSGIADAFKRTGSVRVALQELGITETRRRQIRINAKLPSTTDAEHLQQPRNRPILVTQSVNVDPLNQPIEYSVLRFASDWVHLVCEFDG